MSGEGQAKVNSPRLMAWLTGTETVRPAPGANARPLIGVLEGTGIGPQVIEAALQVLRSVQDVTDLNFEVRRGGGTSQEADPRSGTRVPKSVADFCSNIYQNGGAILHGPEGGRYVYDLRRQFDLFCKFVPVQPFRELARAARVVPEHLRSVDILIVRDNTGGVYQGKWGERAVEHGRVAEHSFHYSDWEVQRLVEVAARAARGRRGNLHVIIKENGVPAVSALWREVGGTVARKHGIEPAFMNVDLAAYELIQNPARFDVIVTPNLFGDILADVAGALVASRGVTFSGNFDAHGNGVYQTNHGCARDLEGTDTANPAGQILSLAMLLRESFGLDKAATLIEESLAEVWRQGWRTADLAEPNSRILGTNAMTERLVQQIRRSSEVKRSLESCIAAG